MKKIVFGFILMFSLNVFGEQISTINQNGNWINLYNHSGKKYKTLSTSSVGTLVGYSSNFFITEHGNWIYLYNSDGRKYKTLSKSSVGNVIGVGGNTFTTIKGEWIYVYDESGNKIHTRHK